MKENQTKTVVCQHCAQPLPVASKVKFFYKEDWLRAEPRSGDGWVSNPLGLTKAEWLASRVDVTRAEFIQSILDRIAALEAAIAEKGGNQ